MRAPETLENCKRLDSKRRQHEQLRQEERESYCRYLNDGSTCAHEMRLPSIQALELLHSDKQPWNLKGLLYRLLSSLKRSFSGYMVLWESIYR